MGTPQRKPMTPLKFAIPLIGLLAIPVAAFAEPDCTEAKDLIGLVKTFHQADADQTNIITPTFKMEIKGQGGHPDPDGIRYMFEDEAVDFAVTKEGEVLGLEQAANFNKDGKLCKLINGALVEDIDEDTAMASMGFTFPFKTLTGEHSYDELREGAKDGSKVMKGLAPGGLGFVVPGLKSIAVRPAEKDGETPVLTFLKKGEPVDAPDIASIGSVQMFKLNDMRKKRADSLRIEGVYVMEAGFNYDAEDIAKSKAQMAEAEAAVEGAEE